MTATLTISVYFRWVSCEADPRPYKPGKPILEPVDMTVEVKVPARTKYISNVEKILSAQISNQPIGHLILTPEGMKYCINELENAMKDIEEQDDFNEHDLNDSNIDWEK